MTFVPETQGSKTFSVEEGHLINAVFFELMIPLIESKVIEKDEIEFYHFFCDQICSWNEYSAEWNEAVYRATNIPKDQQLTAQLSLSQLFRCTLEFCKLNNKHYENRLIYIVKILEAMQEAPQQYPLEWDIRQKAVQYAQKNSIHYDDFDWNANSFHF